MMNLPLSCTHPYTCKLKQLFISVDLSQVYATKGIHNHILVLAICVQQAMQSLLFVGFVCVERKRETASVVESDG